ncbi:bifunctional riboflavin kinase/FAD synthetase [Candidatus Sumerlaeota bacterium]|nr:bifunctional riboflavin kinase/FAD synthetase [Candidatus Sumerlaeota bacterium]
MRKMTVYRSLLEMENLPDTMRAHVTLGVFDGIHLGHQELLRRTVESAKKTKAVPAVFTFTNHPLSVLAPAYAPALLTTDESRVALFDKMGIRMAVIVHFDHALGDLSPDEFARNILVKKFEARHVVCGYNFRFGKDASGNVELLKRLGEKMGFSVDSVEPVRIGGDVVSSTRIREFLNQGMVEQAAEFLGRPYSLEAVVRKGMGRGTKLGYPTANLEFSPGLLIPAMGVYAVWIMLKGTPWKGMMNIGYNPTFPPERFSPEAHLLDFKGSLPGKKIEAQFVKKIRDEIRFKNEKELIEQLRRDEKMVRKIIQ